MNSEFGSDYRKKFTKWTKAAVIGIGCLAGAVSAHATYTIDVYQDGNNVVAQGSGTINLTGLTDEVTTYTPTQGRFYASGGFDFLVFAGSYTLYSGFNTSGNVFGSGSTVATTSSGSGVGLYETDNLAIPTSYSSGAEVSGEDVWNGTTLSSLGFIDGTETLSWGSGANADSLTIDVGAVPEPSTYGLLGLGIFALSMAGARRGLKPAAKQN